MDRLKGDGLASHLTFEFSSEQSSLHWAHEESGSTDRLIQRVISPEIVAEALARVKANKGAPGLDGMTVSDLDAHWQAHGARICQKLVSGDYIPQPVRRVAIPKPGGGERLLGIPSVVDRVVGQMVLLALEPEFDPHFSDSSFGFRRGRSAHDALALARQIASSGREWVIDIDIEKYFDRVNHDILMSQVARRVQDGRVLKLIRRFLRSGVLLDGVVVRSAEGTPQGGPLSPLLANIMLDDLDKWLEARGHRFVRYADDCNIYVVSRRSGLRLMEKVTRYLEVKLRLRVNASKSAVAPMSERQFPWLYDSHGEVRSSGDDLAQSSS